MQGVISQLPDFDNRVTVGFYPNFPETHLSLTVRGANRETLEAILDSLTSILARGGGRAPAGIRDGDHGGTGGLLS